MGGMRGAPFDAPLKIDRPDRPLAHWEREMDSLAVMLGSQRPPLVSVDEMRRGIESIDAHDYGVLSYYEKWAIACSRILIEDGQLSADKLLAQMGDTVDTPASGGDGGGGGGNGAPRRFGVGAGVRVRDESTLSPWSKPHLRTPGYIFGCAGTIERVVGEFPNPEHLAFRKHLGLEHAADVGGERVDVEKQTLYRVRFRQQDLWGQG